MQQQQARAFKKIGTTLGLGFVGLIGLALFAASTPASFAQTLAPRGWMDSGASTKAWWKHLVLYEIDTRNFQAFSDTASSDTAQQASGTGTLKGIAQRLDYLHSLGVDALLLDSLAPKAAPGTPLPPVPIDPALGTPDDFDTLSLEASRRGIRILLNLPQPDPGTVRFWLNRGVAGFRILPAADPAAAGAAASTTPASSQDLHKLLASFAGQRILIADAPSNSGAGPQLLPIASLLAVPSAAGASPSGTVAQLRAVLNQAVAADHGDQPPIPLLLTDAPGHPRSVDRFPGGPADAKLVATVLLGTRASALIDYGQEIGLAASAASDPQPAAGAQAATDPHTTDLPMKWGAPPPQPAVAAADPAPTTPPAPPPPAPSTDGFGTYRPYVSPTKPKPAATAPADPSTAAGQDTDPQSLLNFYRRLSELHRGNSALHDGDTIPLDHDAQNVLVWVRKPRAVTPLTPAVVVLCNFADAPVTLSLKADMARLHLRGSFLRTVLRSDTGLGTMHLDGMTLPPHSVYIGDLRY